MLKNNLIMITAKIKFKDNEYKQFENKVLNNPLIASEYVTNLVLEKLDFEDKFSLKNISKFSSYDLSEEVRVYLSNAQHFKLKLICSNNGLTYSNYINNLILDDLKNETQYEKQAKDYEKNRTEILKLQ